MTLSDGMGLWAVRYSLALIGFTAVVAQIAVMRELMVVFAGNEISLGLTLASWLLWTAVGAGLLGKVGRSTGVRAAPTFALLQCLIAFVFPATIYAVRSSRQLFHPTPGEQLGPAAMFLAAFAVLSVFCTLSGWLFAAGARLYASATSGSPAHATGSVYLLEAIGSAVGGLLASVALIRWLNAFQIASLLAALNLLSATLAFRKRRVAALAAIAVGVLMFAIVAPRLERHSVARLWRGFDVAESRNSVYGNLVVIGDEESRSIYENGVNIFNVPDVAAAEEAVHYALLEHPAPRRVLLLGGGVNGSAMEILRHPTVERVDYVELDPAVFQLAQKYFRQQWAAITAEPRIRIHSADGRLLLKTSGEKYDVIIVNLPDPQTAQLNRFYTRDFFREAAARLNAGGVVALQLRSSENYISPELAAFLACILRTLREVFPDVTAIPGETVHFFGATQPGVLARDAQQLMSRLRDRHLQTSYVREYYLPFRMTADRVHDLDLQLRMQPSVPVNRDFAPVAYYFDITLWSGQFNAAYRRALGALAVVSFCKVLLGTAIILGLVIALIRRPHAAAGYCVAGMGFTLIGLELLLLLGFQAIYGYVYHQLAIVIAAFMTGMALGSWCALRRAQAGSLRTLVALQLLAAASPLLLYASLAVLASIRSGATVLVPLLGLASGLLGGYQFPAATRVFSASQEEAASGTLYALDLAGACIAAVLLSAYFVPVFGFLKTAAIIAVADLALAVSGLWAGRMTSRARAAQA